MPFIATARQIESYKLHKDCCIGNGIPQSTFYHRKKEGTIIAVGPQGLNSEYIPPEPRSIDTPLDPPVLLWVVWDGLNLRGLGQDRGDNQSSRMWMERFLIQLPAIDDSYQLVVMQDDDFILDPTGTRFKLENPVLSSDGSFWKAVGGILR